MNKHEKALELPKILEMVAAEASYADAKEIAMQIEPSTGLFEVNELLKETDEAYILTGRYGSPSFSNIHSVTNALRRAEAGGVISTLELMRVADVLQAIRSVKSWRNKCQNDSILLDMRFNLLTPNKYLEEKIRSIIISEEEISDNASPELAAIRKKIRSAQSKARESLDKMIRSETYQKYLQDAIVTIRGGRFVVPVKTECRSNVPGLVHDTSSSGATVFIEPMSVVEANNEIRVLLSKEQAEIERILFELSVEAGGNADSVIQSYQMLMELNVIFAKASLAYKMKATMPIMNNDGQIFLPNARHPLINKNKVVPTTIMLGDKFDTLVITGPNTGGKTVSLKTIGLLTLMAMCGLMIPAGDDSRLSVFDNILADIGDEQSIEQSLSTFSSHMTNIIDILKIANGKSLVLLDELGAGTDPVEGAALAIGILENLREKQAKIAATTHYAELKAFALKTEGVENGSCEFDVASLRPTYRLLIGIPGRSNAFAISQRLGIEEKIIDRARELVSTENRKFEDVVENLMGQSRSLEQQIADAQKSAFEAKSAKSAAEQELQNIRTEVKKELENARIQAQQITDNARRQAFAVIDELEAAKKKQQMTAEEKAKLRSQIKKMEQDADPVIQNANENYVLPRPLVVGDNVLIFDIDKKATVLKLSDSNGDVLVMAGIIKTKVPLKNLRLLPENKTPSIQGKTPRTVRSRADIHPMTEVDLRGMTADEAIMVLDNAIDSAILSGINQITIIHGKGTGVLRREVSVHLKNHKAIKTFRLGTFGEGESGVTIAELK
ncbi:MAG: endonuclease MutS2 [Bacillota bacterium]|nr:endonuclease MutS2 [Bacillota bacterium]